VIDPHRVSVTQLALFAPEWLVRQDVFARPRSEPCDECGDTGDRLTAAGTTIYCRCPVGDIKRRRGLRSRAMASSFETLYGAHP
jgi:hypothetical protein